jgi:hypothetical protein
LRAVGLTLDLVAFPLIITCFCTDHCSSPGLFLLSPIAKDCSGVLRKNHKNHINYVTTTMGKTNETMILHVAKVFFFLLLGIVVPGEAVTANTPLSRNVVGLIEWIRSLPNGIVSDKISIQEGIDVTSAHSSSGGNIFLSANADISKDDMIMYIPTDALIARDFAGESCKVLQIMLNEYDKGKKSTFYPYLRFLFGSDEEEEDIVHADSGGVRKVTTAAWSSNGQGLLRTLVGEHLLPYQFLKTCSKNCHKVCTTMDKDLKRQQLEQDAYLMVLSREIEGMLIPCKF